MALKKFGLGWSKIGLTISIGLLCIVILSGMAFIRGLKRFQEFVVLSTALCSTFLMVPTMLFLINILESKIKRENKIQISLLKQQIQLKQLESQNLEKQNIITRKNIELSNLEKQLDLLKSTQSSIMKMHDIAEIALLKTNLQQTVVHDLAISDPEQKRILGIIDKGITTDKVLVVSTHNIDAKFGVDLKKIMIKKIDSNSICISGIESKYIGSTKNQTTTQIKELRKYKYKPNKYDETPIEDSITIKNDTKSNKIADIYATRFENEYQESLAKGFEFGFLKDAVVQLAKNFLIVIFTPVYNSITFEESPLEDATQFEEYIKNEIAYAETRKAEKLKELNLLAKE